VLVLLPDTAISHVVKDVAKFLNKRIHFAGHDEGFRKHITALEEDLKKLEGSTLKDSQIVTRLNDVHTTMKMVEDHVVNLARNSRTAVSGLESSLNQYKRQVDRGLSTDTSYTSIMDHIGMLIDHSSETMDKEIKEIDRAEATLNLAVSELTILKDGLLEKKRKNQGFFGSLFGAVAFEAIAVVAEENGNDDLAKKSEALADGYLDDAFDVIFGSLDQNLKKNLEYFERESDIIEEEDVEMQNLKEKYKKVENNWNPKDLEDIAKDADDWENDLMKHIRSLKWSVSRFVSSAGNW